MLKAFRSRSVTVSRLLCLAASSQHLHNTLAFEHAVLNIDPGKMGILDTNNEIISKGIASAALAALFALSVALCVVPAPGPILAKDDPSLEQLDTGDIAWIIVATALVLIMTPGTLRYHDFKRHTSECHPRVMHYVVVCDPLYVVSVLLNHVLLYTQQSRHLFSRPPCSLLPGRRWNELHTPFNASS
jgi:hypothetical protein